MRIIPKKTKVEMEFFKGIGVVDVIVLGVGLGLAFSILLSDLPGRLIIFIVVLVLTIALVVPLDDDKGYMFIYYALKYLANPKQFGVLPKDPTVESITPFTGINGSFIEYGTSYSAVVLQVPSVEFRLFNEARQNQTIDNYMARVLRETAPDETVALYKIDRPILYDAYIRSEQEKEAEIKESYMNGLFSEEELTDRVGILEDRIAMIKGFNEKDQVYVPFHYLVFFHKDQDLIMNHAKDAASYLSSVDMNCHILNGPELAVFLKYQYAHVFDEHEAESLQPSEYLDWILPKTIRMTTRTVEYDGLLTHNFRITKYPVTVGNAWGSNLFNRPGTRAVMVMKPLDKTKSIRQIDRAIEELGEQGTQTERVSKKMEVETHLQTLGEVLRLLQGDNETLFSTDIFLTAYDYEYSEELAAYYEKAARKEKGIKKPVSQIKKAIRSECAQEGFRANDMFMQQFETYVSAAPSALNVFARNAGAIHSSSLAAAFPFVYKHMMDEGGIYLGNSGGVPAFVNFFQRNKDRVNSNMVIIGRSGSGKSFATKTILTHLAAEDAKIFVLDPENEYTKLAKNVSGKTIDVGNASDGRLNPFHVITTLEDDEEDSNGGMNSLDVHLQFLEEFYRQILPGIDPDALEFLNNLTMRVYEDKKIDHFTDLSTLTPADYPTFNDIYDKLVDEYQMTTGEYAKRNIRVLTNFISKFAEGGRDSILWNGETSLTTSENFTVFNFQSLLANKNNTVANAQMLLVLKWLDNEIIKNREYNEKFHAKRKIIIVIDEAHVFIDEKFPVALDFMFQLAKRIRKYNGMQIVITQNIKDFVGTEELARKSEAIINASQYSMIFPLAPNDMNDLVRLYEKAGAINQSEQEDIINNGRGRAFLIASPTERVNVDIIATKDIVEIFNG